MLAARASRCVPKTAHVTRLVPRPVTWSGKFGALRYSTASGPIEDASSEQPRKESTRQTATGVPYATELSVRARSFYLGRADPVKTKTMSKFLHQMNYELDLLHHRRRGLRETLRGPYRVRKTAHARAKREENVRVEDGQVYAGSKRIPNIWLRDNCQCASCMHAATKQRLLDTFSIPQDIAIKTHSIAEQSDVMEIEWSDGHTSRYSLDLLRDTLMTDASRAIQRLGLTKLSLWDSSIASDPPAVSYETVMKGELGSLLRHLRTHGFCYVDNTPADNPDDTKTLLKKIAFIRETHYGGFYDFTADLASKDTAYTNIALEAHTDTTYFSDPAGLQAFHLLSHTDGEGGASLLVDGFKVADELLDADPAAYEILATVNVHGHASGNEGISIQPYRGFPVLEHDTATGHLLRVRWNSSDRASVELPIHQVEMWYDAARKFDALLKKKENEYWEQLKPGRVLIFDNWRVLHGRSSFTGKRRICGAYINRDDWISKFKMAEFGQDRVLEGLAVN